MTPINVVIGNDTYSLPDLLQSGENFNPFEKEVIDLIRSWTSGENQFSLETSGSTGKPKKVNFNREQIINSIQSSQKALGLEKGMNALISLSPKYVAGMMMVLRSLEVGMNMILVEPSSNPLKVLVGGPGIQFAAFVPLQIESILANTYTADLARNIDIVIVGGAPMSALLEGELIHFKGKIFSTYGMTETLTHIALKPINDPERSEHYYAINGVTLDIDDRKCLIISTPVSDRSIITNDIVELSDDKSRFKWLGRADFVINSGGVKIHPENVEKEISVIFSKMNFMNRHLMIGVPDSKLGERSVLLIEGSKPAIHEEVEYALEHSLEKYLVPKEIHYLNELVYTNSGKLDRIKTRELFLNR